MGYVIVLVHVAILRRIRAIIVFHTVARPGAGPELVMVAQQLGVK